MMPLIAAVRIADNSRPTLVHAEPSFTVRRSTLSGTTSWFALYPACTIAYWPFPVNEGFGIRSSRQSEPWLQKNPAELKCVNYAGGYFSAARRQRRRTQPDPDGGAQGGLRVSGTPGLANVRPERKRYVSHGRAESSSLGQTNRRRDRANLWLPSGGDRAHTRRAQGCDRQESVRRAARH